MNSISFNPFTVNHLNRFDLKINHSHLYRRSYDKLEYKGEAIKITGINVDKLTTEANFTEIKNSKIKSINVTGSLYLHDCDDEIESVTASEDIFLYRCVKINHVVANRDVFVIHLPPQDLPVCKYVKIEAGRDVNVNFLVYNKPEIILEVKDCSISGDMNVDENYKKIIVSGDCSKVPKIIFKGDLYTSDERCVIVKKDAIFNGEVVGGKLIFED